MRAAIEREVRESVRRGVAYLEGVGVVSRRGTDGVIHDQAKLLFASFEHSTSRAQDPQLHIHTILINIGVRPDGSTGTLDPRALYREQLAAGALFRAELASRLEHRLGLRARRKERTFEIIGVPVALIEEFSKRRAQIEARLSELGTFTAAAAEKAAFDTRPVKEVLSREELFPRWHEVGRSHHWGAKELDFLLQTRFPRRDVARERTEAARASLTAATQTDSHFPARKLVQVLAEEAQGRGLNADDVLCLKAELLCSNSVMPLVSISGEAHWTTPEMIEMEKHVLRVAEAMQRDTRPGANCQALPAGITNAYPHLSDEQRVALRHVTGTFGRIRVVSGMAGTGKSTLFRAAHDLWLKEGRRVHGACLSGKAAQGLFQATLIPAQTIQRTLNDLQRKVIELDSRSVLVIDEAAMVSTRQMKALLDHCSCAGATLVLCGDARQLQPIESGGVFPELLRRFGAATLNDIKRQRDPWAREAVKAFAEGRAQDALREYAGRGLVFISDEPTAAMQELLSHWKDEALDRPSSAIILASRTADAFTLNGWAQRERFRAGHVFGPATGIGETSLFVGDRVVFTRNDRSLGVFNGQTGTITQANAQAVSVLMDSNGTISFSPKAYPHVQLAYALTTHKAQGMTVERAFIYIDETAENREAAYVQASRARGLCSFYAATESLDDLAPLMNRSRPKVLATALLRDENTCPGLTLQLAC